MRGADQIGRTAEEYAEFKAAARQDAYRSLMRELRFARQSWANWYLWVVDGMPELTQAEYEALKAERRKRPKSK